MHWQGTEPRQLGHTLSLVSRSHPLRAYHTSQTSCNVAHLDLEVQRTDMCAARRGLTCVPRARCCSRGPRGCMLHASRSMQAPLFATNANRGHHARTALCNKCRSVSFATKPTQPSRNAMSLRCCLCGSTPLGGDCCCSLGTAHQQSPSPQTPWP